MDTELIAKLDSEWDLEKEMKGLEDMPPSIKSYLETGPFKVRASYFSSRIPLMLKNSIYRSRISQGMRRLSLLGGLVTKRRYYLWERQELRN